MIIEWSTFEPLLIFMSADRVIDISRKHVKSRVLSKFTTLAQHEYRRYMLSWAIIRFACVLGDWAMEQGAIAPQTQNAPHIKTLKLGQTETEN